MNIYHSVEVLLNCNADSFHAFASADRFCLRDDVLGYSIELEMKCAAQEYSFNTKQLSRSSYAR